jgi:F0F1-type ATP synthase assembly protein I
MNKEQFQIEVAQFLFDQLKANGRYISYHSLKFAVSKEYLARMSNMDPVELNGYTRRAEEILLDLNLINDNDNHLTLKADAFMMPDSTKIKDLLAQKKKKEQFDAHKNQRDLYVNICVGVIALLGFLWNILSEQGSYGKMIGWILVGFAFGVLVSELINKRL